MRRSRVLADTFLLGSLLVLVAVCVAGCLSPEQVIQAQTNLDRAKAVQVATTQAVADLTVEAQKLPADDPVRKQIEQNVAKGQQLLVQTQRVIDQAQAVIDAARTGDASGLITQLGGAPVIGPYVGMAVILGGFLKKLYDDAQNKKAIVTQATTIDQLNTIATQLVKSLDAAIPVKPQEVKDALSAVQDTPTKAFVAQVKAAA